MQDLACRRVDLLCIRIAQHRERHPRKRTLEEIYVHGRLRWRIGAVFMQVTNNPDNGQQPDVSIHVSKFNGVADGILAWPTLARERCADHRGMRRIGAVVLVKHSSAKERNSESGKMSAGCDAKIRFPEPLFLSEEE